MAKKVLTYEIENEFEKKEFIRNSWIALAKEDAPLEVFNGDFEDVQVINHQVIADNVSAELSYQASVGYDRKESYLETESYYDFSGKTTKRERLVTKYKTVTDWSPVSNRHSASSIAWVENVLGVELDKALFKESLNEVLKVSGKPDAKGEIELSDSIETAVYREHISNFKHSVAQILPGDRYKDIDVKVDSIKDIFSCGYLAPEYTTSISYGDKKYIKYAFPFGGMAIGGDVIKSAESSDEFKKRQLKILSDNVQERNNSQSKRHWQANKKMVFLTIALMLVSFATGMLYFLPTIVTTLIGLPFPISLVFTIVNWVKSHKKVSDIIEKENQEETERVHKEIAEYAENRKVAVRDALDKKLISLGFKAVTDAELF